MEKGVFVGAEGKCHGDTRSFLTRCKGKDAGVRGIRRIPIMKRSVSTEDAIELFHSHKMYDKARLVPLPPWYPGSNVYSIDGFEDYYLRIHGAEYQLYPLF